MRESFPSLACTFPFYPNGLNGSLGLAARPFTCRTAKPDGRHRPEVGGIRHRTMVTLGGFDLGIRA